MLRRLKYPTQLNPWFVQLVKVWDIQLELVTQATRHWVRKTRPESKSVPPVNPQSDPVNEIVEPRKEVDTDIVADNDVQDAEHISKVKVNVKNNEACDTYSPCSTAGNIRVENEGN